MYVSRRQDTLREDCDESADCVRNCCVNRIIAPVFFVVFVLMAQFVLVNVVVAVLMKHLEVLHAMQTIPASQPASNVARQVQLGKCAIVISKALKYGTCKRGITQIYLPPTRLSTSGMSPQSVNALWPVLISVPRKIGG